MTTNFIDTAITWGGIRLKTVIRALERREPGVYTINHLLLEHWPREQCPQRYGVLFKWIVRQGTFPRLRWVGQKSDGRQLYEVVPSTRSNRSGGRL